MIARMTTILLAGCGKMGSALLAGWQTSAREEMSIAIVEPKPGDHGSAMYPSLGALPKEFSPDIIVLAVKPQQLDAALPEYGARFGTKPLYLSIAAGKGAAYYESKLGNGARVIRAMPNTPALVGEGMTVLFANAATTNEERVLAADLFACVGKTEWVENEEWMHAVTAISGSGPAYFFLLAEQLMAAGIKAGLPPALAERLTRQTFFGSATYAEADTDTDFATLRQNVTSPGGTTEAALSVLMQGERVVEAVNKAVARSKELADK